jgi:hypothetical protein
MTMGAVAAFMVAFGQPAVAAPAPTRSAMCQIVRAGRSLASPLDSGSVESVLVQGDTVYFGGTFKGIIPPDGGPMVTRMNAGACSLSTGAVLPWSPEPNGHVWAIASDGHRVYLGGEFTTVGGQSRTSLAAVDPLSGAVLSWAPAVSGGFVKAFALSGGTLYFGGDFTSAGGQHRDGLAAADTAGASVRPWAPKLIQGTQVRELVVPIEVRGLAVWHDRVIAGGFFSEEGLPFDVGHVAAFDATTAAPMPWEFKPDYPIFAVVATATRVYTGGAGHGPVQNSVNSYDPATGHLDWQIYTDGNIQTLAATEDIVYAGGHFEAVTEAGTHHDGNTILQVRNRVLAARADTGAVMDWAPTTDSVAEGVWAMSTDPQGTSLVIGGEFQHVDGAVADGLGAFTLHYPVATQVTPSSAEPGSQRTFTVTGSNFTATPTVDLGAGITVESVSTQSSTSLLVTAAVDPSAPLGLRDVVVSDPTGEVTTCRACIGVVLTGSRPYVPPGTGSGTGGSGAEPATGPGGYWLTASDGGIFAFGGARFQGSTGNIKLAQPIVGMAPTRSGNGYWLVASDGGIFAFGDAAFFGSTGNLKLAKPIVGMAATSTGKGYWLVASDGGIFAFGDASFFGSTGNLKLAKPIVAMASTASGKGYWLTASDGGIFAFGDAHFQGSTGNLKLAKPIVGMAPTRTGNGYWLVASDGGIFAFGDAAFHGSTGDIKLAQPIVGMTATKGGGGYYMVASDGGIFAFGDAPFHGSTGNIKLAKPIIGMASF